MTRLWIRLWISGSAMAASVALGVFLIAEGNHRAAQDYYYNVVPWGVWGAFFIALPLIIGAIWLLAAILRAAAAEHRRYRAWKASLPPRHRAAVELAELAALSTAAYVVHEHHKRADARLSASVLGQAPLNQVHAAMKSVSAGVMARSQAPWAGQPAHDPAAASQAVIARRHPEHLGPDGSYRTVPW